MSVSRPSRPVSTLIRLLAAWTLLAALVPVAGGHPPAALAGGIVVNSAADPGDGDCDASCTLRDALLAAAASPGHDTITFSAAVNTPIVLAAALPIITETLTIDGSGQAVTVDGANAYRVFYATAPLTLTALTIQHGRAADGTGGGGAHLGSGSTLAASSFYSNTALNDGGGLYWLGAVAGAALAAGATPAGGDVASITGATFTGNTATAGHGGGAYASGSTVLIGGAFDGNTAGVAGGEFYSLPDAHTAATGVSFTGNTALRGGGGSFSGRPPWRA